MIRLEPGKLKVASKIEKHCQRENWRSRVKLRRLKIWSESDFFCLFVNPSGIRWISLTIVVKGMWNLEWNSLIFVEKKKKRSSLLTELKMRFGQLVHLNSFFTEEFKMRSCCVKEKKSCSFKRKWFYKNTIRFGFYCLKSHRC